MPRLKNLSECKWLLCVALCRREASGEARGCCTFNSSLAIWSVPLRERGGWEVGGGGGAGLEKLCGAPPPKKNLPHPPLFFVTAPGRTMVWWWWWVGGRGGRGAEGLICILLPFACWLRIKPCAGQETHQTHALLFPERERRRLQHQRILIYQAGK